MAHIVRVEASFLLPLLSWGSFSPFLIRCDFSIYRRSGRCCWGGGDCSASSCASD